MSSTRRLLLSTVFLSTSFALPAHAVNKDMIQLQTQIQQLQDAVARLQQSNDERMGVMKDLVQQTADSVNRMSVTVGTLQQQLGVQQEGVTAKSDQISGQIQSLNDSLDELKARMVRLDKALQTIQSQEQSNSVILQNLPGANPTTAPATPAATDTPLQPQAFSQPPAPIVTPRNQPAASGSGPSVNELYNLALGDYMAGKYPLAASEFADVIKQYPDENLSGNAYFYLGEINNRTAKPSLAVKDYDRLLERYPDNPKIPAAHLHKGDALIAVHQTEAGVRELRALIQRFPNSPESAQARTKLNAMGIPIVPRTAR